MKKLTTYIFSAISIFSLIYFTVKYYFDGALSFNRNNILVWTILVFVILFTLILGILNNRELQTIKQQNSNLIGLVSRLIESHENNCDEILTTLLNSREIDLDIYNKIKKGD